MRVDGSYRLVRSHLQRPEADGAVICGICPWSCRLIHGQRGFCQTHVNRHGTLYNLTYGIISALGVDPIEDKPVRRFRPGSRVLSVGSYGCNFRCRGCHNPSISWGETALDALARGESRAAYCSPERLIAVAQQQRVEGIAFTYSEPAIWLEYVLDLAQAAQEAGLYTVYVSNSFVTNESLDILLPHIDVLCSDIKSLNNAHYRNLAPNATADAVLEAIQHAYSAGVHVETRTNIIPDWNSDLAELMGIAQWILEHLGTQSPWHVTRFFPAHQLSGLQATESAAIESVCDKARALGLQYVYAYLDKGCDCAGDQPSVAQILDDEAAAGEELKRCQQSCCGGSGALIQRYER